MTELYLSLPLHDETASLRLGEHLGEGLQSGGVLFLEGTLGAGKTTLTRGLLHFFGHRGAAKSPTYTLVEPYQFGATSVFHFDLYRLGDPEELEFMGIRDYFAAAHVCVLEWPSRGEGFLPTPDIVTRLDVTPPGRLAHLSAFTPRGRQVLSEIAARWEQI